MAAHSLLFTALLLRICHSQGSEVIFVKRGEDLLLDLKTSVNLNESTDLSWKYKSNELSKVLNVAKANPQQKKIYDKFKAKADFLPACSLLLRNVQQSDIGTYTAVLSGEEDNTIAVYEVLVQDEVPKVTLTVKSTSSSECNLTVTCSAPDSNTSNTFRCDKQNCSAVDKLQPEGGNQDPSMNVYLLQGSIVCNYSNQVSSRQDKVDISSYCREQDSNGPNTTVIVVSICVLAAIILSLVLLFFCRKYGRAMCERQYVVNTIYTAAEGINPGQKSGEEPSDPTTTYTSVQFPLPATQSAAPRNNSQPETLYAEVKRVPTDKLGVNEPTVQDGKDSRSRTEEN